MGKPLQGALQLLQLEHVDWAIALLRKPALKASSAPERKEISQQTHMLQRRVGKESKGSNATATRT